MNIPEEEWEGFPFRTLLPPEVGGGLEIYLLTVPRANLHAHERENQVYIIQSGRGVMEIGGERQEVGPGWLVFIPAGRLHALTPLGDEPIILYSMKYPAA